MNEARTQKNIERAIRDRREMQILYKGSARTIHPHTLGKDSEGDVILRAYQIMGQSKSGQSIGWKSFSLKDISEAAETGDEFKLAPGYDPKDDKLATIIITA